LCVKRKHRTKRAILRPSKGAAQQKQRETKYGLPIFYVDKQKSRAAPKPLWVRILNDKLLETYSWVLGWFYCMQDRPAVFQRGGLLDQKLL